MIYFANETGSFTGWVELERRAKDLLGKIDIRPYADLLTDGVLPARTTVLSDHERFTPSQKELACRLWDALGAAGVRRFNDPRNVLNRPRLLETLVARGINEFRAVDPDALPEDLRFPVFVRERHQHTGTLTRLLTDRRQLHRNLTLLKRLGGFRSRDLLVVEFLDVSDENGLFRKYSAFRIGDWLYPRYMEVSRRWMIKADARIFRDAYLREEREYMETNPHRDRLLEIFDLAGIDYGRIDYGLYRGRIQVWEINTNAQVGPRPRREGGKGLSAEDKRRRAYVTEMFHDAFRDRLREMIDRDQAEPRPDISWTVDPALARRVTRELAAAKRRHKVQGWLTRARRASGLRRVASVLAGRSGNVPREA